MLSFLPAKLRTFPETAKGLEQKIIIQPSGVSSQGQKVLAPFAYVAACLCLCCCPFRACALSASDTQGAALGYKLLALQAVC